MARVPPPAFDHICAVSGRETLGELMIDYVRHLEHHLAQILG
jgi:hypothetical protein